MKPELGMHVDKINVTIYPLLLYLHMYKIEVSTLLIFFKKKKFGDGITIKSKQKMDSSIKVFISQWGSIPKCRIPKSMGFKL